MIKKGHILSLIGGNYYTKVEDKVLKCRARGLFRHKDVKPVVGDYVMVEILDHDEGYLIEVLERKNHLIRPSIANIDQALIITSYHEPDYSFNLINKFLAIIEFYNIKPIIIVTKADLASSQDEIRDAFNDYYLSNYPVIITSIETQIGLDEIKTLLKDKVSVLVGQSGAGKSSLLNMVDSQFNIETNSISKALNRGKHTTRHVEIFETEFGMIADSPGFSSLSLDMLEASDLALSYHDFKKAAQYCKFANCLHQHEPGCHVKELVEDNKIPQSRYDDYLIFLEEIKQRKVRY
ncbi:ribosome biogenesis GTPase [Bacilli bacterium PM5-9]|nr:ribosome biogenesis GTPase [Bacilli bacterium PM5-9]